MKTTMPSWAMALAAAATTSAAPAVLDDRAASITSTQLTNMKYFAEWAGTAYCNSGNAVGASVACNNDVCPTVTANKATTYKTFAGVLTDIEGLIAIDPANSLIVITIRGSSSVRNYVSDIVFAKSDCDLVTDCEVHSGFAACWAEVSSSVLAGVKAAKAAYPSYNIVATGHSLGAAVSTLAAGYIRAAGYSVDLYTYGSPRVGNAAFADFITAQSGLEVRVTHLDDPIPRLAPILFGYRHTSPEYWLYTGTANTTTETVSDVTICTGDANTSCNGGTTGFDTDAHVHYFEDISACSSSTSSKRDTTISDADLETRLNMFSSLDVQYAAALSADA